MRIDAKVRNVSEDGNELSVSFDGWAETDPTGTSARYMGTLNIPSNQQSRQAYHIGRRVIVHVRPA
jgi:hypothetical protein